MEFKEYQIRALSTDQNLKEKGNQESPNYEPEKHQVIPLLGMVGEVGGLLSEYKKMLRDGAGYEEFPKQVAEELGDILWYVATVANNFDLNLDKIAKDNLTKTQERWFPTEEKRKLYDEDCKKEQQLPRKFSFKFEHKNIDGIEKIILTESSSGDTTGDPLTDNSYDNDGYRYHDSMHLTFWACFGWSPVFRKLLRNKKNMKKRDDPYDDVEDGGRAQVIEEALVAAAYVYADKHSSLDEITAVDWTLLKHLKSMTDNLEIKDRTTYDWNKILIKGFKIWKKLIDNRGGIVEGDVTNGTIEYKPI